MTKISPIAEYLTKNKAISKRENKNVWSFYSPEGLYLGKQIKLERNGASAYIREMYGNSFKKLYYECKVLGEHCVYYKDDNSPVGINIAPTYTYLITCIIDYLNNKIFSKQMNKELISKQIPIAIEKNTGAGIYYLEKPFQYKKTTLTDVSQDLKPRFRVNHSKH